MHKKILTFLSAALLATITLFSVPAAASEPAIYFYYGDGCPHCALVEPYIDELEKKYPDLYFEKHEVYRNMENALDLNRMFDKYEVAPEDRGVPIVFLNGTYFLGDKPILDNLEKEILSFKKEIKSFTSEDAATDPMPEATEEPEEIPVAAEPAETDAPAEEVKKTEPPSLWMITSMALVDSINPCAIAVLVILLGALLTVNPGEKKRILKGGLAFTFAIYISYFLFGLGISFSFQLFQGSSYWIYKAMGVLAIMLGLGNMKDFFWYGGGGFVMEIPRKWRPSLQKMLRGVTSPAGAFLAGFAVTLFELPCTGGPYFVVLGLLAVHESIWSVIPILLYYNVFFVLPLLVITGLIYMGFSNVEKAGLWKDKHIRGLHFVAGTVMVILGVWVLLS